MNRARGHAWVVLAVILLVVVGAALAIGRAISDHVAPDMLGQARPGEWMTLADGFDVRVDDVTAAREVPASFEGDPPEEAPAGMQFVVVDVTTRYRNDPELYPRCFVHLIDRDGAVIANPAPYGVGGGDSIECAPPEDLALAPEGEELTYVSRTVLVTLPAEVGEFDVKISPDLRDFWLVSLD